MISRTTGNRHCNGGSTRFRRASVAITVLLMSWRAGVASAQELAVSATEPLPEIRAAALSYIKGLLPRGSGQTTVAVGALDGRLRLARCPQPLSAALPAGVAVQARMTIGVTCPGPIHWTVYVPATVESTINVLELTHAVARDTHLGAGDVTVETRRTAGPGTAYLSAAAELSNRTVRRPLAAGTILTVDMFAPDLIIRRGQEVTLLSSGGAIEVRASGRAMNDAAAGARVQVQNLSSMRIVEGVVETADVVRVAR